MRWELDTSIIAARRRAKKRAAPALHGGIMALGMDDGLNLMRLLLANLSIGTLDLALYAI
jgi:hypothetical protein